MESDHTTNNRRAPWNKGRIVGLAIPSLDLEPSRRPFPVEFRVCASRFQTGVPREILVEVDGSQPTVGR